MNIVFKDNIEIVKTHFCFSVLLLIQAQSWRTVAPSDAAVSKDARSCDDEKYFLDISRKNSRNNFRFTYIWT